jgi:hypothetical protein
MKLVSPDNGNALQLFRLDEARATSGIYLPDLVDLVRHRYRFLSFPTDYVGGTKDGVKFGTGAFRVGEKTIEIKRFDIYSDGLFAAALTTDDVDMFLYDFIGVAADYINIVEAKFAPTRTYGSAVVVDFDVSIDAFIKQHETISSILSSSYTKMTGRDCTYQGYRLAWMSDPADLPPHTHTQFSIERRAGVPYSENRYYSVASLSTAEHLSVLQQIEALFLDEATQ